MSSSSKNWSELLESLLSGEDMSSSQSQDLMKAWLSEELTHVQTGAFLAALRAKGASGIELASMANILRQACEIPVEIPKIQLVDTCGTGGDGADTFNISTAVAFLAAACGVNVAKHGNRSASGNVGSADVLEALGLNLKAPLERVVGAISKEKVTFLFAPAWHASLINLAPLRKSLGIRTIFNLLGPLVNPLKPRAQVLGVAKHDLLDPMAEALLELGTARAVVVHGFDGLDEVSLQGPNQIRFVNNGEIRNDVIDPLDFGLNYESNSMLKGGDVQENKTILLSVLSGEGSSAQMNVVSLNNSLVLWAAGMEDDLKVAFEKSLQCLKSGAALKVFENLKSFLED